MDTQATPLERMLWSGRKSDQGLAKHCVPGRCPPTRTDTMETPGPGPVAVAHQVTKCASTAQVNVSEYGAFSPGFGRIGTRERLPTVPRDSRYAGCRSGSRKAIAHGSLNTVQRSLNVVASCRPLLYGHTLDHMCRSWPLSLLREVVRAGWLRQLDAHASSFPSTTRRAGGLGSPG